MRGRRSRREEVASRKPGMSERPGGAVGSRQSAVGKAYQSSCGTLGRAFSSGQKPLNKLGCRRFPTSIESRSRRVGLGGGSPREGRAREWNALSADGGRDGRKPALGPLSDGGQYRLKRASTRGESIAHTHRRPRIHEPLNDPLRLQLAQSFGEHAVADAGYAGEELIETRRAREQGLYDRPGPALSNQLDCALKGRAVVEAPTDH